MCFTNNWIQSFLSKHKQAVVQEDERSYCGNATSSMPQGSILGPCLFLMYINNMPDQLKSIIRLFVDDTMAYLTIEYDNDVQALQHNHDLVTEGNRGGRWRLTKENVKSLG